MCHREEKEHSLSLSLHRFMMSLLLFVVFLKKSLFLVKNVISFTTPMYSKCLKALPTWSDLKQLFSINGDQLLYPWRFGICCMGLSLLFAEVFLYTFVSGRPFQIFSLESRLFALSFLYLIDSNEFLFGNLMFFSL